MKHLSNYTFEEFKEKFSDVPFDIVEIVYSYYHRNKSCYVKLAKKFLEEKDAYKGKAFSYYTAMNY